MNEDEDMRETRRILQEVKSGKQKLLSKKEFEKLTGTKL